MQGIAVRTVPVGQTDYVISFQSHSIGVIVAVLIAGWITGYILANNNQMDDSDGMTTSEINENLHKYADALNSKGEYIRTDGMNLQIKKGPVGVENGGTHIRNSVLPQPQKPHDVSGNLVCLRQ